MEAIGYSNPYANNQFGIKRKILQDTRTSPFSYAPQAKASKCYECNTPLNSRTLKILWKDCCECSFCGKFIIMDINNMQSLGIWKY